MLSRLNNYKWFLIILSIVAVSPIFYTVFEVVTTNKESVVLLEDYSTSVGIIIISFYVLIYLFFISIGILWLIKQIKVIIKLKNEKAKTELLHLKSQVNPHFFFNTLNNLYGLIEKDSKSAKTMVLKLSDMMRYSIYDGQKDYVKLEDEIIYLNNYVELHKMRYHKKIDIKLNCQIQENYRVMPLLFIILLENAFKHGVENLRKNAYVHINILTVGNEIQFSVENNFDSSEKVNLPGIGLKNLKRRLELVYPEKHSVSFSITEDRYKAQLTLKQL